MSKVALVTCGSRGIGRAISAAPAGAGYSVIVNYETEMLAELAHDSIARARLTAQFPIGRFGRPEEVAEVVRFLVGDAPDYLTGESIDVRGGRP